MAETTDWNKRFDNIRLAKLEYEEKTLSDIISSLNLNEEDSILCEDIIKNLEHTIVEEVNNKKCVQIPYIGSIRKNPLKETLEKNRTNFKIAAKTLSKEGAKEHFSLVFKKRKEELRLEDYEKSKIKELRRKYKSEYERLYIDIGPAYANLYIKSKMWFKAVEFNQDFEDKYQELMKNEKFRY